MSLYEFLDLLFTAIPIILDIITAFVVDGKKVNEYVWSRHASLKALTQPFCRLITIINLQ